MKWTDVVKKVKAIGGKIKNYKKVVTISSISLVAILGILLSLPGTIVTTSGDISCSNICTSYINVTNSKYNINITNISEVGLDVYFDQQIKGYKLYIKDDNGNWVTSVPTYIYKPMNTVWEFKLEGQKDPTQTVKWGVRIGGVDIDPYWYATAGKGLFLDGVQGNRDYEIGKIANISCYNAGGVCNITINSSNCVGYCYNFTGSGTANFTTYANQFKFNDGNPWKYFSANGLGYIYLDKYIALMNGTYNISWTTTPTCYQESANVTNQSGTDGGCTLNYTGSYVCTGSWGASYPCSNTYDGSWATAGAASSGLANVTINYTKPIRSFAAVWHVQEGGPVDYYVPIPDSCFNYYSTNLSLLIVSTASTNTSWYCWNGAWNLIHYDIVWHTNYAYEEGILWNMTSILSIDFGNDGTIDLNITGFSSGVQFNTNITNIGISENITLVPAQKIVRYISLFKYMNVTTANITFIGYSNWSEYIGTGSYSCTGDITSCGATADGSFSSYSGLFLNIPNYGTTTSQSFYQYSNMSVDNTTTYVNVTVKIHGGEGSNSFPTCGTGVAWTNITVWNNITRGWEMMNYSTISGSCDWIEYNYMINFTLSTRNTYFNDSKVQVRTQQGITAYPRGIAEVYYYDTKVKYDAYPNIVVDFLNDGVTDYSNISLMGTNIASEMNKTLINNYLNITNCNTNRQMCVIPLTIYSAYGGTIKYSGINFTGTYLSIPINTTAVQNYLTADPFRTIFNGKPVNDQTVDIAVDTNNRVHYLYMNNSGSPSTVLYGNNTADINTFTEMSIVSGDQVVYPSLRLALNATNYARAIYMNRSVYGLRLLKYTGTTWTNTNILATTGMSSAVMSSLYIDSSDYEYFAFTGYAPTYGIWFAFRNASGWNFERINDSGSSGACLDLTRNASGTFFFAYRTLSPVDSGWMAIKTGVGTYSFSKITNNYTQECRMRVFNNNVSIAIEDGAVAGVYYLDYLTWNGTGFTWERVDAIGDIPYEIALANDSAGMPKILYNKNGGNPYYYYAYKSKGVWYKSAINNGGITVAGDIETDYINKTYIAIAQSDGVTYNFSIGVKNSNNVVTVPVNVTSTGWGTFNITAISIPYNGSITYNISATNGTDTVSYIMNIFWSNFTKTLPRLIQFPYFIPLTPTSTNVRPVGQTNSIPIWNIISNAYDKDFDVNLSISTTATCVVLNMSNQSTFVNQLTLNSVSRSILNCTAAWNGSCGGIWINASFNCPTTTAYYLTDYLTVAKCTGCV